MSFASDVKAEFIQLDINDKPCLRSELHGMIKIGAALNQNRLNLSSYSAAVARRALTLIRKLYPNAHAEIAVARSRPSGRKSYSIRLYLRGANDPFLRHYLGDEFPVDADRQAAYLRGAFLARGTISRPEKHHYHWEIAVDREEPALFLSRALNRLDFPAKIFTRKGRFVVYIKPFDSIVDFLSFTGAQRAVERCESAYNLKQVRRLANQLVNCETHCLQQAVDAAQRQISDIKIILKHKLVIDDELQQTAQLRLENPEMSMPELAPILELTTSGVKARMRRIHRIAQQLEPNKKFC